MFFVFSSSFKLIFAYIFKNYASVSVHMNYFVNTIPPSKKKNK